MGEVLSISRMSPNLIDAWLDFFDNRAFVDTPEWAACYCMAYLREKKAFEAATSEENRSLAIEGFRSGSASGLVAIDGGEAVGWVRFAPKPLIPFYAGRKAKPDDDNSTIGSIVCFMIDRRYRGKGVAKQLLEAACGELTIDGFSVAEGYPWNNPKNQAEAFPGPLPMYLSNGFETIRELARITIVQRRLG